MKNTTLHRLFVTGIFCCSICLRLYAQEINFSKQQAMQLVAENAAYLHLTGADIKNVIVSDAWYDKSAKTAMVYLQQAYKGVPVWNVMKVLAFKDKKIVSASGSFISKIEARVNVSEGTPSITSQSAVSAATNHVGHPVLQIVNPATSAGENHKIDFGTLGAAKESITAKLLWVPGKDEKLTLCWQVAYSPLTTSDYWLINVDAANSAIVSKVNLTVHDQWNRNVKGAVGSYSQVSSAAAGITGTFGSPVTSSAYRVIPFPAESMNHDGGTPIVVNNPWEYAGINNLATTLGWHDDGTVSHDSTRGNNVWAREDVAGDNGNVKIGAAAISQTASPTLTFNFPFDSAATPSISTNQKFAITQLFYWNNIMHDISYQYGFDEPAGNFQNSNLGRGGTGHDYVIADAQDGAGTDNAVFSTPDDGSRPRMQMYLWSSSDKLLKINSPGFLAGYKPASESAFSSNNKLGDTGPVTGNVKLYDADDTGDSLGCAALSGSPLTGKVALIYRGTCAFTDKVKNAQNAGAIAAIIINNNNTVFAMSGQDNSITIPAILITKNDGDSIKSALQNTQNVRVTLKASLPLDGDLDNGIMAHEYTHGISNRLTGGPSNSSCLINREQMGEGWSDYFALMTTTNWSTAQITDGTKSRPLGTYVYNEDPATGIGIRTYPYSTNMNINPWSYEKLATQTFGEPHYVGEIWTSVLWDMTWNLIQTDGINANLYDASAAGGNSAALKLVTEGMKLQPCLPGFIDGRDAILKADTLLFSGKYSCGIWKAFARRGMGLHAQQGSSDDYKDQVADYNPNAVIVKKSADKVQASANEDITYTLSGSCRCGPVTDYTIIDTLPVNVSYVSGGTYNSANRVVSFSVPTLSSNESTSFTLQVKVNNGVYEGTDTLIDEPVHTSTVPASWNAPLSGTKKWRVSSSVSHSAPYSFKAVDPDSTSRQVLATAGAFEVNGECTLSFWHWYNTEDGFDRGIVEISPDSGDTWIDAKPYIFQNGYNYSFGYSGNSGQFIETLVNLSFFNKKRIMLRFVLISDRYAGADGWYIDDIMLKNEAAVYNLGQLFDSNGHLQGISDTITTIATTLPLVWGPFTVQKTGAASLLKWTTMQEHNTADFIVERSADALSFKAIKTVRAIGESNVPLDYSATDETPVSGVNYYRIKQVDKDGKVTYSAIRSLDFDQSKVLITVTPNPAKDKIIITVTGNQKPLQAAVVNSAGQTLESFIIHDERTEHALPKIAAGVYYLKIEGDGISATKKLVLK